MMVMLTSLVAGVAVTLFVAKGRVTSPGPAPDSSPTPQQQALVHGDYNFHNLLFDGDRLSAVLDWELSHVGHPAEDLGYIKQTAEQSVAWEDFMAAYRDEGGGGRHMPRPGSVDSRSPPVVHVSHGPKA